MRLVKTYVKPTDLICLHETDNSVKYCASTIEITGIQREVVSASKDLQRLPGFSKMWNSLARTNKYLLIVWAYAVMKDESVVSDITSALDLLVTENEVDIPEKEDDIEGLDLFSSEEMDTLASQIEETPEVVAVEVEDATIETEEEQVVEAVVEEVVEETQDEEEDIFAPKEVGIPMVDMDVSDVGTSVPISSEPANQIQAVEPEVTTVEGDIILAYSGGLSSEIIEAIIPLLKNQVSFSVLTDKYTNMPVIRIHNSN